MSTAIASPFSHRWPQANEVPNGHDPTAMRVIVNASGDAVGHVTVDLDQACPGPSWPTHPEPRLAEAMQAASDTLLHAYGLLRAEDDPLTALWHHLGIPHDYGARHRLRRVPEAANLIDIGLDCFGRPQRLCPPAATAWAALRAAADADGICLELVSAFRSVAYQAGLIERKLKAGQAVEEILKVSAAPGFSEHHSGRALDLSSPGYAPVTEAFAESDGYHWLQRHAQQYGFVCSFPPNNRHGLIWEPWHWCYQPEDIWR